MDFGRADPSEYDAVYAMGYDVWGEGLELEGFLEVCRTSLKYAGGRWFVVREGGEAMSSLLVHDFESWQGTEVRGIGSLATRPERRCAGWAARLLEHVSARLVGEEQAAVVFLYADIDPRYYERRGFHVLDALHQTRSESMLMARFAPGFDMALIERNADRLPSYF